MGLFDRAVYTASAHDLEQLLPDVGREVAFVGRSNSGKSSAINTLANHKRLAYVSKTPGRTQLINFSPWAMTVRWLICPATAMRKSLRG